MSIEEHAYITHSVGGKILKPKSVFLLKTCIFPAMNDNNPEYKIIYSYILQVTFVIRESYSHGVNT